MLVEERIVAIIRRKVMKTGAREKSEEQNRCEGGEGPLEW
jgi:hypothetical protein